MILLPNAHHIDNSRFQYSSSSSFSQFGYRQFVCVRLGRRPARNTKRRGRTTAAASAVGSPTAKQDTARALYSLLSALLYTTCLFFFFFSCPFKYIQYEEFSPPFNTVVVVVVYVQFKGGNVTAAAAGASVHPFSFPNSANMCRVTSSIFTHTPSLLPFPNCIPIPTKREKGIDQLFKLFFLESLRTALHTVVSGQKKKKLDGGSPVSGWPTIIIFICSALLPSLSPPHHYVTHWALRYYYAYRRRMSLLPFTESSFNPCAQYRMFVLTCVFFLSFFLSFFLFKGFLPAEHPAKDPVSSLHKESAMLHSAHQPQSLPVLPTQEMHHCRNEPRWLVNCFVFFFVFFFFGFSSQLPHLCRERPMTTKNRFIVS